jgi:O-antigen/teichoic acid export membrane protein
LGVIKRQGILGSFFIYVGVFIGFITSSILFSKILKQEQIGLILTLLSYAAIFAQIGTLGFTSVTIRMFSYFRNYKNHHNGFFAIALSIIVVGFLVSLVLFFALKPVMIAQNKENSALFVEYIYYLLPIIFFSIAFSIIDTYNTVLFQAVRGIFLKEFVQRILILIALILYYYQIYSFKSFVGFYIASVSMPAVLISLWLIKDGEFKLRFKPKFITPGLKKSMISMGFFGVLYGISGIAAIQIDKIMMSSMLSLDATGIYGVVFIFAALIRVPSRAVLKISSAVIAEAWKRNDLDEIDNVYRSTAINQYIIGLLVFVGLWANIENIFRILGDSFEAGKYVIFFFGLAYTFDMASGANNNIIASSKHYKYLSWFIFAYLLVIIVTNLLFIPKWGITGAAIASALSLSIFILTRILFVYFKFGIQPFNYKFLILSAIGLISYFLSEFIPLLNNLYIDIILRSALITLVYVLLTVILKISPEVNGIVQKYKTKLNI